MEGQEIVSNPGLDAFPDTSVHEGSLRSDVAHTKRLFVLTVLVRKVSGGRHVAAVVFAVVVVLRMYLEYGVVQC